MSILASMQLWVGMYKIYIAHIMDVAYNGIDDNEEKE